MNEQRRLGKFGPLHPQRVYKHTPGVCPGARRRRVYVSSMLGRSWGNIPGKMPSAILALWKTTRAAAASAHSFFLFAHLLHIPGASAGASWGATPLSARISRNLSVWLLLASISALSNRVMSARFARRKPLSVPNRSRFCQTHSVCKDATPELLLFSFYSIRKKNMDNKSISLIEMSMIFIYWQNRPHFLI